MSRSIALILILCTLGAVTFAGTLWGARRTHNAADYLIASRRLNIGLTALSFTANALPVWLMFLLVGTAFVLGLAAIWMAGALLLGCALNWFYIAPRLRQRAAGHGSVSVVQILGADVGERLQATLVRCAAGILIAMLLLLIVAQLHLLATVFVAEFDVSLTAVVILAAGVIALYVAVGGYWAASLADSVNLVAVLLVVLLLPFPAALAAGGLEQLQFAVLSSDPAILDPFGGRVGVVAVAFVAGLSALGLALPGQPQALSRFIASRDDATVRAARWLSLGLMLLLLAGLLVCGWCAQVLYAGLQDPDLALIALAVRILPPGTGAVLTCVFLAAIAASVTGQLLVIAALVSADLKRPNAPISLNVAHVTTALAAIVAAIATLHAPATFLDQSLLAFTVLGAAFGPLVIVRVAGKRIRPGAALGALWAGAMLTFVFHALPDSPGDFLERVLPFFAALGIALSGGERRANPDRADRAQETVHDRVPI